MAGSMTGKAVGRVAEGAGPGSRRARPNPIAAATTPTPNAARQSDPVLQTLAVADRDQGTADAGPERRPEHVRELQTGGRRALGLDRGEPQHRQRQRRVREAHPEAGHGPRRDPEDDRDGRREDGHERQETDAERQEPGGRTAALRSARCSGPGSMHRRSRQRRGGQREPGLGRRRVPRQSWRARAT